jgi:predicted TPR repeat methyltransferase
VNNQEAYNHWADSYDHVENKTRDLEALALRQTLTGRSFDRALEIGCGTGKNTSWLSTVTENMLAVDFSEQMLTKAKSKITSQHVAFLQADITKPWNFVIERAELITCSLILEHIENLDHVFQQAAASLKPGGLFYVCELHPFKQYIGSKARFATPKGMFELECFTHHVSDYINAAQRNGFQCNDLQEWFDERERKGTPRLISFLFAR